MDKGKLISKMRDPRSVANFTVGVKFKATEIENEIVQNLQMEFYVNTADHEIVPDCSLFQKKWVGLFLCIHN